MKIVLGIYEIFQGSMRCFGTFAKSVRYFLSGLSLGTADLFHHFIYLPLETLGLQIYSWITGS